MLNNYNSSFNIKSNVYNEWNNVYIESLLDIPCQSLRIKYVLKHTNGWSYFKSKQTLQLISFQ